MSMPAAFPQSAHQRSPEPSMEEILASIRKIIAEDQKALDAKLGTAPIATDPLEAAPAVNDDDRFDHESQASAFEAQPATIEAQAPVNEPPQQQPVVVKFEPHAAEVTTPPVQAPVFAQPAPQPVAATAQDAQRLLSDDSAMAAGLAFQSLSQSVARPARTMDELVSDMLRPMLSAWLDDNLPALVERLVKAEIERVSRGGR